MIDTTIAKLGHADDSVALATLQVDVIADLICPWSFLGKRRLDEALQAVHGPSLVSWYPFQLNPDMPTEGMGFDDYVTSKFGDRDALAPALEQLANAGHREGIEFRFDRIKRVPNTLDGHRLIKLAEDCGADVSDLADRLLRAFFEQGADISDREVLTSLGHASGLSAGEIGRALEDDTGRQIVLSQEAQVRKGGVSGVPNFLVNKRLFVMGAQTTDVLVKVFDRAMFGEDSDQPVSPTVH